MSDKKNIDRLFQEKFKDFEAAPPEFVWENIREVLEEKKKKRVIPLWFRLGGVAAVIVIALLLGNFYLNEWNNSNATQGPAVTTTPGAAQKQKPLQTLPTDAEADESRRNNNGNNNTSTDVNSAVVVNGDGKSKPNSNENTGGAGPVNSKVQVVVSPSATGTKNNAVVHSPKNTYNTDRGRTGVKQNSLLPPDNKTVVNKSTKKNTGIAQPDNAVATNNAAQGSNLSKVNTVQGVNQHVNTSNANNNVLAGGSNKANKNSVLQQDNNTVADNALSAKNNTVNGSDKSNVVVNNNAGASDKIQRESGTTKDGGSVAGNTTNNAVAGQDKGMNDDIPDATLTIDKTAPVTDNAVAETAVDTAAVAPENELEKLLREKQQGKDPEKDKQLAENSNKSKWNVKPQVAPVFYNSMSSAGSPIDDQFASNTKSYDNNLSMGVGVNYALTERINIRSGVNTVNLNYATKGIEFYASLNGQTNNVAAKSASANIVVQDQDRPNTLEVFFADRLPNETFSGSMVQRTGYVEVPVEMSYALLNKKFGIDIIGGVSTLFLNQNNVSVISTQGYSTNVGKAQNLNNIHFSTNVGVGFKYRFLKSFEANFEPMFKYQVNTFSRDAGNFKPYFIGLYSGISFSF